MSVIITKNYKGFTLIELLIAVSIVAVLTGVVITVLNPTLLQNKASDGVTQGNLSKLTQAIEAHNVAEGSYPTNQAAAESSQYIKEWPGSEYSYARNTDGLSFCVSAPMESNTGRFYKIATNLQDGKIGSNCTTSCSTGTGNAGCTYTN